MTTSAHDNAYIFGWGDVVIAPYKVFAKPEFCIPSHFMIAFLFFIVYNSGVVYFQV